MRLIFMGTPPFAATILSGLIQSDHDVVATYSQPPRQSGRGHKVIKSAVQICAETHNIPVLTPPNFKAPEDIETFQAFKADIAIVAAYGLILPAPVLEAPRLGCINIHASLLPRWRGAAPIQYALLSGDLETGITLMKMDHGLDTGPMLAISKLPLPPMSTSENVTTALANMGRDLLLETLPRLASDDISPLSQPIDGVTHSPKVTKDMGRLSWSQPATQLERQVRALNPWPGTWIDHEGQRLKVLHAKHISPDREYPLAEQGVVQDDALTIACAQDLFQPTVLQKPGGNPLETAEFLRGFPLPKGTKFS